MVLGINSINQTQRVFWDLSESEPMLAALDEKHSNATKRPQIGAF
jgi:hypothetical protein